MLLGHQQKCNKYVLPGETCKLRPILEMLTSPYMEMHGRSRLAAGRKGIVRLAGVYKDTIKTVKGL